MLTLYGPGVAYGTRTDIANATPCNFGKIKSMTLDADFTVKPLTGQFQAPIDFGRGELKFTGKLKMAQVSYLAMMSLFWGVTQTANGTATQFLEAGAIPGSSSYTVTVTNSATFVAEQEVVYAATALPFTKVTSLPTAGQYSVSAGVFTFAAADAGKAVLISYAYTITGGYNLSITNQLQGVTPTFSANFFNTKNGKQVTYSVPLLTATKLNRDSKENDWTNPEIDVLIGANAAGQIITENFSELS